MARWKWFGCITNKPKAVNGIGAFVVDNILSEEWYENVCKKNREWVNCTRSKLKCKTYPPEQVCKASGRHVSKKWGLNSPNKTYCKSKKKKRAQEITSKSSPDKSFLHGNVMRTATRKIKVNIPLCHQWQTNVMLCQICILWTIAMLFVPIQRNVMISVRLERNSKLRISTKSDTSRIRLSSVQPLKQFHHCKASLLNDHHSKIRA